MGRRRKKLYAQNILDFRHGTDQVIRQGSLGFIHDPAGIYADQEIDGDMMTPEIAANLDQLTDRQAAFMFEVVRTTPFLSPEGKRERLGRLLRRGQVKLRFEVIEVVPAEPAPVGVFGLIDALGLAG